MRVFCSLLILTLGVLSPMLSCAADLSKWLVNLKREVTRLAIDERAHLHSIARMRNSVIGEEDLFLISDVDLGALDIQLMLKNKELSGVQHIYIEQEEYASTPFESMQYNMNYLKNIS